MSNIGWTNNLTNGNGYGNTSENLEALKIGVDNLNNYNLTIKTLDTQNKNNTYTNVTNSTVIGSTGQSLGLKMINMSLSNSNCAIFYNSKIYCLNIFSTNSCIISFIYPRLPTYISTMNSILMEIGQNGYHKVMIVDQKILEL